ncbi:MAG TPA: fumarate hydratase, partial [Anaerovoracaceae bacterium]|nr:fumarate hydratase [Anaerovoracaceae bacterium]
MREMPIDIIRDTVKKLYLNLLCTIGDDITVALKSGLKQEASPTGRRVLRQLLENNEIARRERIGLCQDTGMAVLFMDLGQEIHLTGGSLESAVNQGVREAYEQGYSRKSVVADPLYDRINTADNTPAVIHLRLCPGDKLRIKAMAKGFGSENMSAIR